MIVGATPMYEEDEDGKQIRVKDKKGRPMWNMPEPVGTVQHKKLVKVPMQFGKKTIKVKQTIMIDVPVYRGYSERFINYARSQRAYMSRQYEKKLMADLARQEKESEEAANANANN